MGEQNPYASQKYMNTEQLMLKISKKMGGIPADVKPALTNLRKTPLTPWESCKMGATKAVDEWLADPVTKEQPDGVDDKDHKGITALAYAVGADRLPIVKSLVGKKADVGNCDTNGNTAVHYAAGYGRKEVLDYLLGVKGDANKKNSDGKTPLDLAIKNNQAATQKALEAKGGKKS